MFVLETMKYTLAYTCPVPKRLNGSQTLNPRLVNVSAEKLYQLKVWGWLSR